MNSARTAGRQFDRGGMIAPIAFATLLIVAAFIAASFKLASSGRETVRLLESRAKVVQIEHSAIGWLNAAGDVEVDQVVLDFTPENNPAGQLWTAKIEKQDDGAIVITSAISSDDEIVAQLKTTVPAQQDTES